MLLGMLYRVLADVTVVGHFLFVCFVVFGGLLVWRWPRVGWLHVPAVCWAVAIEWLGGICPLTPLEGWLRFQGGMVVPEGDFIGRVLLAVLYPSGLTRGMQVALGALALTLNVVVYGMRWRGLRRRAK